jgi:hypothetical protein
MSEKKFVVTTVEVNPIENEEEDLKVLGKNGFATLRQMVMNPKETCWNDKEGKRIIKFYCHPRQLVVRLRVLANMIEKALDNPVV